MPMARGIPTLPGPGGDQPALLEAVLCAIWLASPPGPSWLRLLSSPQGSSQAGSEPWAGEPPGHSLLPRDSRIGAPWGELSCRQGAAGTGQEAGRLPARSCWLESRCSEWPDLSGGAAVESCTRGQE